MNERINELAREGYFELDTDSMRPWITRRDIIVLARAIMDQQAEIDALREQVRRDSVVAHYLAKKDPSTPPPHPSALKGVRQLTEELGVCRDPDVPFRHYGIRAARAEIKIRCEALKTAAEGRFDLGWNAFADRIIEEIEKAEREP